MNIYKYDILLSYLLIYLLYINNTQFRVELAEQTFYFLIHFLLKILVFFTCIN